MKGRTRALFKNNAINKKDNLFKVLKIIILKFYTQQKKKVKNIIFRQTKPKKKNKKKVLPANMHYKKW